VLPIAPTGLAWGQLTTKGRVSVRVNVTYTPTTPGNGIPASRSAHIMLIKDR